MTNATILLNATSCISLPSSPIGAEGGTRRPRLTLTNAAILASCDESPMNTRHTSENSGQEKFTQKAHSPSPIGQGAAVW